jgi:hypothetical protein
MSDQQPTPETSGQDPTWSASGPAVTPPGGTTPPPPPFPQPAPAAPQPPPPVWPAHAAGEIPPAPGAPGAPTYPSAYPAQGYGYPPPPGYPAQGYGYPPASGYPPPGYVPAVTTSTSAIVGLVLAVASWILCPIVLAIVALVLAKKSGDEIAASQGRVGGEGLNTATKVVAWVNIGLYAAIVVIFGAIFLVALVLGAASGSTS